MLQDLDVEKSRAEGGQSNNEEGQNNYETKFMAPLYHLGSRKQFEEKNGGGRKSLAIGCGESSAILGFDMFQGKS